MQRLKDVSWFRLIVFVGLSIATQMAIFLSDEVLTRGEVTIVIVQCLITGFSYLQCPEATSSFINMRGRKNDVGKTGKTE